MEPRIQLHCGTDLLLGGPTSSRIAGRRVMIQLLFQVWAVIKDQNLPTGGHEDGTAVITESDQIPRIASPRVRSHAAERRLYVPDRRVRR